ncbi:MAG: DMT family transporter [Candidatus Jidaibacter sp.]|jgi:uncharacterized membrane protein|nr:DMT family transporter [Candidatus Jidaibacter sp.]
MSTIDFILILFSAMLHAGWNFYTKKTEANKISILWLGWCIAGILTFPLAVIFTDFSNFNANWIPFFILTGVAHALYLYTLGMSYNIGEMSLIYPISRGLAIFFTISIMLILKLEVISAQGALGVIFLILGIIFVAIKRLGDLEKREVMMLSARTGMFISTYSIIDKISLNYIPPLFYINMMFIITSLIMCPIVMKRLNGHTWAVIKRYKFYSGAIGLVSFFTYYLVLLAMQSSPASYVVALRELSIVFGSVLGMWLLKEEKSRRKIAGICGIVFGAYIIKTS